MRLCEAQTKNLPRPAQVLPQGHAPEISKADQLPGVLAPQFLSTVPIDPMSAKHLRYRLNGDGSFTLYSVGEGGRDDRGDPKAGKARTS
jgi:hypothetical protein